jgi:hypothetical protein
MQACPSCTCNLPERAIYCANCGSQARCKECRDILEPNARACVTCGSLVEKSGVASATNNGILPDHTVNTLEFEETTKGRSLRAKLTDSSVANLSNAFGRYFSSSLSIGVSRDRRVSVQGSSVTEQEDILLADTTLDRNNQQSQGIVEATVPVKAQLCGTTEKDSEKLRQIFRYDGKQLRLNETRLKAKNKLDEARRLTYLFLYAHELEGREQIPRTELNDILKKTSLYDSNTATWIGKSADLMIERETVGLRLPGQEQAKNILAEVLDLSVPNEWTLGTGRVPRGTKCTNKVDGGFDEAVKSGNRKACASSKVVVTWVTEWKNLRLPVDAHSVIKDCSVQEKGIFGLWAIRKATNDAQKVVSGGKLTKFLYEAFEIKVDERGLERSLKSICGKGNLIKVTGGFQLQPPGMATAEKIAGLTKSSFSSTTAT